MLTDRLFLLSIISVVAEMKKIDRVEKWRKGGFVSQCFEEVESVVICDEKRTCFEKRGDFDGFRDGSLGPWTATVMAS